MEVSVIIMVVVLSFVWFVDWTDCFIRKGGIRIFQIFSRSVFVSKNFGSARIACSLRLTDFLFFGIWFSVFVKNTCLMGFRFDLWCGFLIFLLGFRFLLDPTVIMRLHWSRIAAKPLCAPPVNAVSDRLRFWELRCEHLYVLHAVFGF